MSAGARGAVSAGRLLLERAAEVTTSVGHAALARSRAERGRRGAVSSASGAVSLFLLRFSNKCSGEIKKWLTNLGKDLLSLKYLRRIVAIQVQFDYVTCIRVVVWMFASVMCYLQTLLIPLCAVLARPCPECCSQVWTLQCQKNTKGLESGHRRAAEM